jgi:hypothetical protein
VSSDREDKVTKEKKPLLESVIEKKSIVNLVNLVISLVAFKLITALTGSSILGLGQGMPPIFFSR